MKRILLVSFLLLATLCLFSQSKRGLKGNSLNTENYPTISFVWNDANPNELDKSQFVLTENNMNIDFQFEALNNTGGHSKSILFLWEDMASHRTDKYDQSAFTRDLLKDFFSGANLNSNDKFNVAVFNRKKNGQSILNTLSSSFVSDVNVLIDAVKEYKVSTETFTHNQETDLYSAISEGVRLLKNESTEYQSIIVITAGKNLGVSGASMEMESVRREAAEADIPIYAIKFPIGGDTPNLDVLCGGTYGYTVLYESFDQSLRDLNRLYNDLDERCYGHDYKITFNTNAEKDGNVHQLGFSVGKVSQDNLTFTAPSKTFAMWVEENLVIFIAMIVAFIVIVVLVVLIIRRRIVKRNNENAKDKAMLEDRIRESNQNLANMQQQHEREKRAQMVAEELKRKEEEYGKLENIMHVKNLYPRLQCNVAGSMFTYSISKPVTKVGRNDDNDLVLANRTVSGFHAEIIFDGASFVLHNRSKSYTQGIIVNGQFFQQCTLKNGDIIGFGEAVVTFYL